MKTILLLKTRLHILLLQYTFSTVCAYDGTVGVRLILLKETIRLLKRRRIVCDHIKVGSKVRREELKKMEVDVFLLKHVQNFKLSAIIWLNAYFVRISTSTKKNITHCVIFHLDTVVEANLINYDTAPVHWLPQIVKSGIKELYSASKDPRSISGQVTMYSRTTDMTITITFWSSEGHCASLFRTESLTS